MLTDQPNILAIIRRNHDGHFEQMTEPVEFHQQPMLTIIPNADGVYVVLGLLYERDKSSLTQLIRHLESRATAPTARL